MTQPKHLALSLLLLRLGIFIVFLVYFAAWPMLAACIALFLLREHDTLTLSAR